MEKIQGKYEGYVWWSDNTDPTVFSPATAVDISLNDGDNPFIIEGELYDAANGESTTIRFIDGHYVVKSLKVEASDLNGSERATVKTFLAHRMPGITRLKYLRYWDTVKDELCEDMETLQPGRLVFIGFINDKEK